MVYKLNSASELIQRHQGGSPMQTMYYIGLDVHKRTISYCLKDGSGAIHAEGTIPATRFDLDRWIKTLPQPWTVAMEATVFTEWIYDHLQPYAAAVKVAHPQRKRRTNRIDASKICDCLRCDFLPGCYMASTAIRAGDLDYPDEMMLPFLVYAFTDDNVLRFAKAAKSTLSPKRR